jgi:hypothetical protein
MHFSRILCVTATVALIAGCTPNSSTLGIGYGSGELPNASSIGSLSAAQTQPRSRPLSEVAKHGIYVVTYSPSTVLGYRQHNTQNDGPICTIPWNVHVPASIAVDRTGALIVPDPQALPGVQNVEIGTGPDMCGPLRATITDPYGYPTDAAVFGDAATGIIAVANSSGFYGSGPSGPPGNIAICTIAKGCYADLTSRYMYTVGGIAMDKHGNCWASAVDVEFVHTLTYFKHCAGTGIVTTGYSHQSSGGLEVDRDGNIVSLDSDKQGDGLLWVYGGCKPACTVVGGPFTLHDFARYGRLNGDGTEFAAASETDSAIDIYAYTPTSLTYEYNFWMGIGVSPSPQGVAYNRPVKL